MSVIEKGACVETRKTNEEMGVSVRRLAIKGLTGASNLRHVKALADGDASSQSTLDIDQVSLDAVRNDLLAEQNWVLESWILDDCQNVSSVDESEFYRADPTKRFSTNYCLRKPSSTAFALRGFLSALISKEVQKGFSDAFGEPVEFKSVDIARYKNGHYLRRHADNFEDRRFGLVFFFNEGWLQGDGGELVVENECGQGISMPPKQGSVGYIAFRKDCYHQVMQLTGDWERLSVAVHYRSAGT